MVLYFAQAVKTCLKSHPHVTTSLCKFIVTESAYNEPVVVLLFIMMGITSPSTNHHLAEKMAKTVMASNLFGSP